MLCRGAKAPGRRKIALDRNRPQDRCAAEEVAAPDTAPRGPEPPRLAASSRVNRCATSTQPGRSSRPCLWSIIRGRCMLVSAAAVEVGDDGFGFRSTSAASSTCYPRTSTAGRRCSSGERSLHRLGHGKVALLAAAGRPRQRSKLRGLGWQTVTTSAPVAPAFPLSPTRSSKARRARRWSPRRGCCGRRWTHRAAGRVPC
jgi:hypothetical protein